MPDRARPTWDVPGLMHASHSGRTAVVPWHIRTYPDGYGYARMGDLWVPIPAALSAIAYLEAAFVDMFGRPLAKAASGD